MASHSRAAWALLILRLSAGLHASAMAWPHLHAIGFPGLNVHTGLALLVWALQFLCGGLLMLGVAMPWSCLPLIILAAAPLRWPFPLAPLFTLGALVASAVGGPGRWALGKE